MAMTLPRSVHGVSYALLARIILRADKLWIRPRPVVAADDGELREEEIPMQELRQLAKDLKDLLMRSSDADAELHALCDAVLDLDEIPTSDAEFLAQMQSSLGVKTWSTLSQVPPLRQAVYAVMLAASRNTSLYSMVMNDRIAYAKTKLQAAERIQERAGRQ